MLPLYIDSDTIIRLDQNQNPTDDAFVNDATVTFTLQDADGVNVAGAVDISMDYVAASDGRYEGLLQDTVDIGVPGTEFDLLVLIVSARTDFRKIRCVAGYRGVR